MIVVAYRSRSMLLECLGCLASQLGISKESVEIILVDNTATSQNDYRLSSLVSTEIRMKRNVGACIARNVGAAWASAPILAFVDDDGLVQPEYLSRGLAWFDDPQVLGVRGRIIFHKHRYFSSVARHYDRGDQVTPDCLVTEGNCFIRRHAFLEVGGFAERLSPHEGIELSYRLARCYSEGCLFYVPDVVMQHDYCASWRDFFRKIVDYADPRQIYELDPQFQAYLEAYGKTEFPVGHKRLDERVARHFLQAVSGVITQLTRASLFKSSPYANPS